MWRNDGVVNAHLAIFAAMLCPVGCRRATVVQDEQLLSVAATHPIFPQSHHHRFHRNLRGYGSRHPIGLPIPSRTGCLMRTRLVRILLMRQFLVELETLSLKKKPLLLSNCRASLIDQNLDMYFYSCYSPRLVKRNEPMHEDSNRGLVFYLDSSMTRSYCS